MTATNAEIHSTVPTSFLKQQNHAVELPKQAPTSTKSPLRRKCLSSNNLMERAAASASSNVAQATPEDIIYSSLKFQSNRFVTHRRSKTSRNERFQKHYTLGPMLGKGGFGTCFRCTHIASGQDRACKVFIKSDKKKENRTIIHEFKTLAELDHPNIIKVYEMFEDKKHFFIVTELYEGGDLFELIDRNGPMREQDVAIVIQRLLCCVNYCHEKGIVHRDLKPENVLLPSPATNGQYDFNNIKLIDFGLARHERPNQPFETVVGSPFYVSPQVVEGKYHRGCDIWAVGALAYVLLCGRPPFEAPTNLEVLERISVGWVHFDWEEFDFVTPDCTSFVRYLMTFEEEERPTASAALQHPWIVQHCPNTAAKAIIGTVHVTTPIVQQDPQPGKLGMVSSSTTSLKDDIQNALNALLRFQSRTCKLKQATGALLTSHFLSITPTDGTTTSETQRVHDRLQQERLDALFRILDRRHMGTLSVYDLQLAFADYLHMYLTQEEIAKQLWPNINFSGSGSITYSEFVTVCTMEGVLTQGASNDSMNVSDKIKAVYNVLDTDQKGYLNNRDLLEGFRLDPETADIICHKMIAEVVPADDDDDDDDDDFPPVITRQLFERVVGKTTTQETSSSPHTSIPQMPVLVKVPPILRRKIRRTRSMIAAEAA